LGRRGRTQQEARPWYEVNLTNQMRVTYLWMRGSNDDSCHTWHVFRISSRLLLLDLWFGICADLSPGCCDLCLDNRVSFICTDVTWYVNLARGDAEDHACMHACIHTHIHTYIHTYRHTYTHTYIHTNIDTYRHAYIHT
jgi:hypothetical protein